MKVLWFVNTPFPPVDQALPPGKTLSGSGWWMSALLGGIRRTGLAEVHVAWGHNGDHHSVVRVDRATVVEAFPFWRPSTPSRAGDIGNSRTEAVHLMASRYPVGVDGVIERVAPDVIHVHGTEGPAGLLLQHSRVPTVISIQGSAAACAARFWGSQRWSMRLRHPRGILDQMQLAARGRRETEILSAVTAVAGRTSWDERFCRSLAPQATYYRAFECIRPEFLSVRHRPHGERREKQVLVVSSAQPYKGTDLAIRVVTRMRAAGRRVKLVLAGTFPTRGWGSEIRDLAAAAGPEAVQTTGYLSAAEIAERLVDADAFVMPSHIENSPNSLLEAMAVGVPCVAARVGGVPSMLRHNHEGLLFRRGDGVDLEQQLGRMLNDCALASRLGSAAAERARATCKPEDVTRATIRMYEDVAGIDTLRAASVVSR